MKIKLSWNITNDSLFFDPINEDLAKWFIETSQQLGNNYAMADMVTDIPNRSSNTEKLINEISNDVDRVNEFIIKTIKQPPVDKPTNWCDQQQLNKLHKDWALTRKKWPTLDKLLYKIDPTLFDSYHRMNCHIHLIETSFKYDFRDPTHWRVNNPFKDAGHQLNTWEECHLAIKYPGHGREAFEKFQNLDEDVENISIDDCNWDNVDPAITIKLTRPYKRNPPTEFLEWCKSKNLIPYNSTMPLGNLTDWKNNITNARTLFMKNNKITKNHFSLSAVE